MKSTTGFQIVLVTAPDLRTGRRMARAALARRLIACANLIPRVESHYWWQGKVESGAEVLLVMKTRRRLLVALEKLVLKLHPYDTPEFLVLPVAAGHAGYLAWLAGNTGGNQLDLRKSPDKKFRGSRADQK